MDGLAEPRRTDVGGNTRTAILIHPEAARRAHQNLMGTRPAPPGSHCLTPGLNSRTLHQSAGFRDCIASERERSFDREPPLWVIREVDLINPLCDVAGLPWTGARCPRLADLGDSACTDAGRTERGFHMPGNGETAGQWPFRRAGMAHCKTVGSAYVGSNPTPATTCENGPLAAETRPGGPLSSCPITTPCVSVCHRGSMGSRGYGHIADSVRDHEPRWRGRIALAKKRRQRCIRTVASWISMAQCPHQPQKITSGSAVWAARSAGSAGRRENAAGAGVSPRRGAEPCQLTRGASCGLSRQNSRPPQRGPLGLQNATTSHGRTGFTVSRCRPRFR